MEPKNKKTQKKKTTPTKKKGNTSRKKTVVRNQESFNEKVQEKVVEKEKSVEEKDIYLQKITFKNLALLIFKIIIIFVMFYFIFTSIFGILRVRSEVMSPSIRDGDLLIYYRLDREFRGGDAVVAKINGKRYVMRIAGIPGDFIEIDEEEGRLLINGAPEEHIAYYRTVVDENSDIQYPFRLDNNQYFLVNDYRSFTEDSRRFGAVMKNDILGKVIGRLQTRNI